MMNSHTSDTYITTDGTIAKVKLIITTALLVICVFALCGCSSQSDGSVLKVQTGEKTLLDIKKNPDEKVSIEVDVPKVHLKLKQDPDVKESFGYTTHPELAPPAQPPISTDPGRAY